jgi:predicted aspartyl protease
VILVFNYLTEFSPPAPFVLITIGHPTESGIVGPLPARVDSAADRTVIPQAIAEALHLEPSEERQFEGLGGRLQVMSIYPVSFAISGREPLTIEVAAHKEELYVLLGRDVLNQYCITLDGPNQRLEIA